jgi:hypothetical protein
MEKERGGLQDGGCRRRRGLAAATGRPAAVARAGAGAGGAEGEDLIVSESPSEDDAGGEGRGGEVIFSLGHGLYSQVMWTFFF